MSEILEAITPSNLVRQKAALLPALASQMDERSVATILEMSYDTDTDELASEWFDACMAMYRNLTKLGKIRVYRHMMVEDFDVFIQSLNGTGHLGQYWSFDYSIESPTWKQDQRGNVPISIEGLINTSQVDWQSTLHQNFEWPHEWEVIFTGNVFVERIENRDTDTEVKINKNLPR